MANNYVIARKDVCAGELLKPGGIVNIKVDSTDEELVDQEYNNQGVKKVAFYGGIVCRGMLFSVNENGLSNDLIYDSPEYPIDGIKPEHNVTSNCIITHYVELEALLKHLKYNDELTQDDLNNIFNKLITHTKWLDCHPELVGWANGKPVLSKEAYENLSWINCSESGTPSDEEPNYGLIKKRI